MSDLTPPNYVDSKSLPLPLAKPISEQPLSNKLPLALNRKLGTVDDAVTPPSTNVVIDIAAAGDLKPKASITASYDSNVYRGLIVNADVNIEQSKLIADSKTSSYESNLRIERHADINTEQSKLVTNNHVVNYESNDRLIADYRNLSEQSELIASSNKQSFETLRLISSKHNLKTEQSKLVGDSVWYSFEAMAFRQLSRIFKAENAKLTASKLATSSEYAKFAKSSSELLIETAKLPSSYFGYIAPSLYQTVILKKQEFAKPPSHGLDLPLTRKSGEIRRYVYSWSLPLPLERKIADRDVSSNLAMTLDRPRGVYVKQLKDNSDELPLPLRPRRLPVNTIDDVVLCSPKNYRGIVTGLRLDAITTTKAAADIRISVFKKADYSSGVIFVINDALLIRTDSGEPIRMLSFNVGIDDNSYCWAFSASVPYSELSKVDITKESMINVDLLINGIEYRFILDGCDDNSQFANNTLSIKGKSRALMLAHPFAQHRGYKYTAPMTARQIAEDELNRGSVPSGFALDWQIIDELGWQVPANTYSYSNRTPINSLQWIAEAAGGFINAHPSADIIKVLSRYPIPSWEWASQDPDITIPQQLITSRSRSRVQKPLYNGVMVSGEREGSVSALVKRKGTTGGFTPNQVTHDLISDFAVARHRGICELSNTGDMGNIGLSIPLVRDIGLLTPSTLIRVDDGETWIGMVRGTSISGTLVNDALSIEQSIDVERHFDKEVI